MTTAKSLYPCPVCVGQGGWDRHSGVARRPVAHTRSSDEYWNRCPYCRGDAIVPDYTVDEYGVHYSEQRGAA